jgi:RNA polymerase sigma-70 factor (sigma-E family)
MKKLKSDPAVRLDSGPTNTAESIQRPRHAGDLRWSGRKSAQAIRGDGQACSTDLGFRALIQQIGALVACKERNPNGGGVMTFEEFAAERLPGVLRFAAILTGDRALAEDLAQEVLIRAHSRWSKIGSLDRPEYYVRKMILNEFLDWRRREWRLIPSGAGSDVDHRSSPDHAVGYAERDALIAKLSKLPARQRAVLALRYYEGLCDIEIADLIGCKPGTVRGYAARALAALRVEMNVQPDQAPAFIKEKI